MMDSMSKDELFGKVRNSTGLSGGQVYDIMPLIQGNFLNWNYNPGRLSEEIAKKLNLTQTSAQDVHIRIGEVVRDAQARGAWEVYGF